MASLTIDNINGSHSVHIAIARQNSIAVTEKNGGNKLVVTNFLTVSSDYCEG